MTVATDPNTQRQIRNLDDMIRSSRRNVDNLKQQIKLLQRQESDAKRLPNSSREISKIQSNIRQSERDISKLNSDVKTFERQKSELQRMAR